jgi:hypothetical protein
MSATHFFVALACIPDLLKCAKHLFVAAIGPCTLNSATPPSQ